MKDLAVKLFMKAFGGRIASVIASAILAVVFAGIGKLAALNPQLAAMIDPNAVAEFSFTAVVVIINALSNHFHLTAETSPLIADLQAKEGIIGVQIKKPLP